MSFRQRRRRTTAGGPPTSGVKAYIPASHTNPRITPMNLAYGNVSFRQRRPRTTTGGPLTSIVKAYILANHTSNGHHKLNSNVLQEWTAHIVAQQFRQVT